MLGLYLYTPTCLSLQHVKKHHLKAQNFQQFIIILPRSILHELTYHRNINFKNYMKTQLLKNIYAPATKMGGIKLYSLYRSNYRTRRRIAFHSKQTLETKLCNSSTRRNRCAVITDSKQNDDTEVKAFCRTLSSGL